MTLNDEAKERRSKLVQQQPSLPFVWRLLQLRKYQDCRRGRKTGLLNRRIQHYFNNFKASLTDLFAFFSWSSRLIILYAAIISREDRLQRTISFTQVRRGFYFRRKAVYNHWTGPVDWTGGLTLKIIIMLSNDTRSPVRLCGSPAALFLATHMVPEQITHYRIVFMRVFVPSV